MAPPFFSVIVPVYNKEPYVARALHSVLRQSFEDFELIAVCDPSSDGSEQAVSRFEDGRVRMLCRDKAGPGGYAARNLGIEKARGRWIAFLDADDAWDPDYLANMAGLAGQFPDISFLAAGWETVSQNATVVCRYWAQNKDKGAHTIDAQMHFDLCTADVRPVHTSFACIRRDSPVAVGLFPAETRANRGGDLHAWLKAVSEHKRLAWGPFVGGQYHTDVDGQVTRHPLIALDLFDGRVINPLKTKLAPVERRSLSRYLNHRLYRVLVSNKRRGSKLRRFWRYVNWEGDALGALKLITIRYLVPKWLILFASWVKSS